MNGAELLVAPARAGRVCSCVRRLDAPGEYRDVLVLIGRYYIRSDAQGSAETALAS